MNVGEAVGKEKASDNGSILFKMKERATETGTWEKKKLAITVSFLK